MDPDGISYLDIGDAYWRGDWHHALNAYWSPLYSWILGFVIKVLRPTPYWEYPLVHFVNFLIFIATLVCFDFFLVSFVSRQQRRDRELQLHSEMGIPSWTWFLLGYAFFICASLVLIREQGISDPRVERSGIGMVCPDLLVFLFVCLDCALLVRLQPDSGRRNFVWLGIALGFGFLAKSILFPLGLIFLIASALSTKSYRAAALSGIVFLAISTPFILCISYAKHRLTFGDSGRITYAAYIDGVEAWYPGDGGQFYPEGIGHAENIDAPSSFSKFLLHPVKKIFDQPATYLFEGPVGGTYPFWYDVSYWQDGIRPSFDAQGEWKVLRYSLLYLILLTFGPSYQLITTASVLLLFVLAPRPSSCVKSAASEWYLLAPAAAGIFLYAIVHLEFRYIAPLLCMIWIALFSAVRLPASTGLRIVVGFVVTLVALFQVALSANAVLKYASNKSMQNPVYSAAALALRQEPGLTAGFKIAMISDKPWGEGGPFVARLARVQIVAQVNNPKEFWSASPAVQGKVLDAFSAVGADAVLSWEPQSQSVEWKQLRDTSYFLLRLDPGSRNYSDH